MAAKDNDDAKTEDREEDVSLDMSQAAVKKMIADARERGYITYDQLNEVLPPDQVSSDQIEDVMSMLSEMGINVIEDEEAEDDGDQKGSTDVVEASTSREVAVSASETEKLDRTDDPVRMYLREMGSVELLSREGEIAIAKRIEAGRNTMIAGLCESPLTFQAITIWRDELLDEDILLRDVIDHDAARDARSEEGGVCREGRRRDQADLRRGDRRRARGPQHRQIGRSAAAAVASQMRRHPQFRQKQNHAGDHRHRAQNPGCGLRCLSLHRVQIGRASCRERV